MLSALLSTHIPSAISHSAPIAHKCANMRVFFNALSASVLLLLVSAPWGAQAQNGFQPQRAEDPAAFQEFHRGKIVERKEPFQLKEADILSEITRAYTHIFNELRAENEDFKGPLYNIHVQR